MRKVFVLLVALIMFANMFGLKVIMVTDAGGLGDKSFNDGTWAGVQMAVEQLPDIEAEILISKEQTDYVPNLTNAAQRGDVVIGVGFMMADVLFNFAMQYPDTFFIGIDIEPSPNQVIPSNLALYTFKEEEGGFLLGYLAASMTKTNEVGFIGGVEISPVKKEGIGDRGGGEAFY
ncbi:BMP family ABC transporter substrate-binding protein [Petrotoga sp. 9T1HF07.CasAA.8.2]|uniref:BMP family ABC transporter substrate-binding protein n=1 Tax=Petrotoga sp. 9T1HF07.CasAA.8.2 TaxID=1434329 RepID=UPI000EFB6FC8|nr:BMP family ABC transporter substrate-binding protein [Petrotoga sp. 9T1HF07.CasAA.8.2]